jgi:hypothetical protein
MRRDLRFGLVALLLGGTCRAAEAPQVWPAGPPDQFAVHVGSPDRAWQLAQAAEGLGPVPSLAEQGGADIQYCPSFRPDLYPERNLAQLCGDELLDSPLLTQGEDGHTPFRTAFREVDRLDQDSGRLALRALLTVAYYWQHRKAPDALDEAAQLMVREQHVGVRSILLDAAAPAVLHMLPRELSGLPPYEELGQAYDLRVATSASLGSVVGAEPLLREAAARGLQGLAVTDLDLTDGLREVERVAERLKRAGHLPLTFLVIPGEEVTTLSGPVLALFVQDRLQRGMTLKHTIDAIRRQGGLAVLADPGSGSGPKHARTMRVDGYLLRSQPAAAFRTLNLMGDPALADLPLLGGSGSRQVGTVGAPYAVAETGDRSAAGLRQAFDAGRVYGATGLQMPLLTAMLVRPLAVWERSLATWFRFRDRAELAVERLVGSDNVELRTSYDREFANLLGVIDAPATLLDLFGGDSPLTRTPRLVRVSADYGPARLEYTWDDHTVRLLGAVQW